LWGRNLVALALQSIFVWEYLLLFPESEKFN